MRAWESVHPRRLRSLVEQKLLDLAEDQWTRSLRLVPASGRVRRTALLRSLVRIAHAEASRLAAAGSSDISKQFSKVEQYLDSYRNLIESKPKVLDRKLHHLLQGLKNDMTGIAPPKSWLLSWEELIEKFARRAQWHIGTFEGSAMPEDAESFDAKVTRYVTLRKGIILEVKSIRMEESGKWFGLWRYCSPKKLDFSHLATITPVI